MSECARKNKWVRPCRFEPRYDSEPHNGAGFEEITGMRGSRMIELLTKRTYVRDVCVTCGKTVER